jgi:3-hydroxyisobutyrate dehydrogenase-like beta-hydroxyacid dehydrogenase
MSITVAVIGAGEMGSALGARMVRAGGRVLTSLAGRGEASARRAREAGVLDAADDAIRGADYVLSIVPPVRAVETAQRFVRRWAQGAGGPVFVDCNAVAPRTAAAIAEIVERADARFVDGAIIGAPGTPSGPGPVLYLSGDAPRDVAALSSLGLRVRHVDGPTGAASALKMTYSGVNKGLTALCAAMALAAHRAGVTDALRDELAESQPMLLAKARQTVPDMFPKAYRFDGEMHEIAAFCADDPATRMIYEGAAQLYARLAADHAGDRAEIDAITGFLGSSDR